MKPFGLALLLLGIASAAVLAVAAAPSAPPDTRPATTVPALAPAPGGLTDAQWRQLLARLGDANYTVREQAQKDLSNVDFRPRATIKRLADASADPEIKDRLTRRLGEIADQLAVDPPPISLDITNATRPQALAALSAALQVPTVTWASDTRDGSTDRFTLQAADQPFWEVFAALNRQHKLEFHNPVGPNLSLPPGPDAPQVRTGGFRIVLQSVTAVVDPPAASRPSAPPQIEVSILVMADPRIRIVRQFGPRFTDVIDDAGNVWLSTPATAPVYHASVGHHAWYPEKSWILPPHPGRKITSLKGVGYFEVQMAEETVEVPNFQDHWQHPITVAGRTITFPTFSLDGGFMTATLSDQPRWAPEGDGQEWPAPIRLRLTDASGHSVLLHVSCELGNGAAQPLGGLKGSVTLQASAPTRTRRLAVPFEFTDIPLPPVTPP